MSVIWKYEIEHGQTTLAVPGRVKFCHVANVAGHNFLWVEVDDPSGDEDEYTFELFPTGGPGFTPIPGNTFLGTILEMGGALVWHIYGPVSIVR